MSTRRVTRAATALKELDNNATIASSDKQRLSSEADGKTAPRRKRAAMTEEGSSLKKTKTASSAAKPVKAARPAKTSKPVKGGWVLPHGMGSMAGEAGNAESSSGEIGATAPAADDEPVVAEDAATLTAKGSDLKMPDDVQTQQGDGVAQLTAAPSRRSEAPKRQTRRNIKDIEAHDPSGENDKNMADFRRKTKRGTANKYGLTRGSTPYPFRTVPTKEQCEEVHGILTEMHGEVKQPKRAPAPSTKVAGCGEVPSVLDALLRTLISGNTLMANADLAVERLGKTYGILKDGIGAGSIDWDAVRLSPMAKLVNTIRPAGCPQLKSKHIKAILDMVYEEQKVRAHAHIDKVPVPGAQNEDDGQKAFEVQQAVEDCLSLEHMRAMTADEAITEFVRYPGIGVKTAACVVLFCLRFPCFAVDTHVHKFCKWLGWVPEKANELDTFNHGEFMVPDHLKYGLHQLFIRHGQVCFKCRKNTKPGTDAWKKAPDCPLEHLLDRSKDSGASVKEEADAEEDEIAEADGHDGDDTTKPENKGRHTKKPKTRITGRAGKKGKAMKAETPVNTGGEPDVEDTAHIVKTESGHDEVKDSKAQADDSFVFSRTGAISSDSKTAATEVFQGGSVGTRSDTVIEGGKDAPTSNGKDTQSLDEVTTTRWNLRSRRGM